MNNELNHYLEIMKDLNNPIYYSIILGIVLVLFLYINYYQFYLPSKKKHILEKKELNLKNKELEIRKNQLEFDHLKVFADLSDTDPNAIIRINKKGVIIYKNNCAGEIFGNINSLEELLPGYKNSLINIIDNGSKIQDKLKWEKKYFLYYLRGIVSLEIAQITFFDLTSKIISAKKISYQKNRYKSLSLYLQNNLEKEKQRIGIELHDNIFQNLYLIKLKIGNSLNDGSDYKKNIYEIDTVLDETLSELRDIVFDLKPKVIEDLGLFNAVQVLIEKVTKVKKITGKIDFIGEILKFDFDTDIYIFRIIQESLNNIIRHSEATEFSIQFIYSEKYLMIMVSDNGHGFDTGIIDKAQTYGLMNMSERVKALGGKMSIDSSPAGTLLQLKIPYKI
jgi:signal transduction histidine kinase